MDGSSPLRAMPIPDCCCSTVARASASCGDSASAICSACASESVVGAGVGCVALFSGAAGTVVGAIVAGEVGRGDATGIGYGDGAGVAAANAAVEDASTAAITEHARATGVLFIVVLKWSKRR